MAAMDSIFCKERWVSRKGRERVNGVCGTLERIRLENERDFWGCSRVLCRYLRYLNLV